MAELPGPASGDSPSLPALYERIGKAYLLPGAPHGPQTLTTLTVSEPAAGPCAPLALGSCEYHPGWQAFRGQSPLACSLLACFTGLWVGASGASTSRRCELWGGVWKRARWKGWGVNRARPGMQCTSRRLCESSRTRIGALQAMGVGDRRGARGRHPQTEPLPRLPSRVTTGADRRIATSLHPRNNPVRLSSRVGPTGRLRSDSRRPPPK